MTDIVSLNTSRRIKDESGNVISDPYVPPSTPNPPASPASRKAATAPNNHWVTKHTLAQLDKQPDWIDEQLLVQDIKANAKENWVTDSQKILTAFPTLKLCSICALNLVPQSYETCTVCNNAEFPESRPYFADELGRRHPVDWLLALTPKT